MKLYPLALAMLLATGCADRRVEPASQLEVGPQTLPPDALAPKPLDFVTVVPFQTAIGETLKPPPVSASTTATFEPSGQTSVSMVRSVVLRAKIVGADPGEVAVEVFAKPNLPYERKAKSLGGSGFDVQEVEFVLPVAGTMIETSNLHGKWTAQFFVQGKPVAVQNFELTP